MFESIISSDAKYFDETSTDDDPAMSTTTMMIPNEWDSHPNQNQDELMWKIICLVFIVLTTVLLISTICLWRALPSLKLAKSSQQRSGVSMQSSQLNEQVV